MLVTFVLRALPPMSTCKCRGEATSISHYTCALKPVSGEICGNRGIHVHLCANSERKQIPEGSSESGTAEQSVIKHMFFFFLSVLFSFSFCFLWCLAQLWLRSCALLPVKKQENNNKCIPLVLRPSPAQLHPPCPFPCKQQKLAVVTISFCLSGY